jgi:hypothetical protein
MGARLDVSGSDTPELSVEQRTALQATYTEVCANHRGIADFRAKLLALLPTVSGAAIFVLLARDIDNAAIGLFGFAVTFGLFLYDLRGIQDCVELRRRAGLIEGRLGIVHEHHSPFHDWPDPRLASMADEVGAGWIVYTALLASWLFLAGRGLGIPDAVLGAALIVAYLAGLLAFQQRWGDVLRGRGREPQRAGRANSTQRG